MTKVRKKYWLVAIILVIAFFLRLYGINWDKEHHLHPDERMIIMVADRINFFSNLDPDFFNYGSLPIYILKGSAQLLDKLFSTQLANYHGMLFLGRFISTLVSLLTIVYIYKLSHLLFKDKNISLLASFFYAIAFFPIQNSHFYTVDPLLTLFATIIIYLLLKFSQQPNLRIVFFLAATAAAAAATKFTGVVFLPFTLAVLFVTSIAKLRHDFRHNIIILFKQLVLFCLVFFVFFFVFMPYAFLKHQRFVSDILLQLKMNSDPFIFPYTLQYVNTTPYLYFLKNIFLWGLGPILSTLALIGFFLLLRRTMRIEVYGRKIKSLRIACLAGRRANYQPAPYPRGASGSGLLITVCFYLLFFLLIGRSAVKFMRYLLPLYPFLVILAAVAATRLLALATNKKTPITRGFLAGVGVHPHPSDTCIHNILHYTIFVKLRRAGGLHSTPVSTGATHVSDGAGTSPIHPPLFLIIAYIILIFLGSMWTLPFLSIYSRPHTRITASEWIYRNIPAHATLALEHWDDGLPLPGAKSDALNKKKASLLSRATTSSDYNIIQLPLYDPDTPAKWQSINEKLAITDFIIIASNRLYTPLMKLTDCSQLPEDRCYPLTAQYYRDLFSGRLGFTKVAEFTSYPRLEFGIWNLEFRDEVADESFTVYDHPKVMIFKRT